MRKRKSKGTLRNKSAKNSQPAGSKAPPPKTNPVLSRSNIEASLFGAITIVLGTFQMTFILRCIMVAALCGLVIDFLLYSPWTVKWRSRFRAIVSILAVLAIAFTTRASLIDQFHKDYRPEPFPFVKPGPLFNPNSADAFWDFIVVLRGYQPIYNVLVDFQDMNYVEAFQKDNSRIDLLRNDTLQRKYLELDPDVEARGLDREVGAFYWKPLVLENEHFEIQIVHREGIIAQELRLKKIKDKWEVATRVRDKNTHKLLIECRDPLFPADNQWPTILPPCFPLYKGRENRVIEYLGNPIRRLRQLFKWLLCSRSAVHTPRLTEVLQWLILISGYMLI